MILIDYQDGRPIYEQIVESFKRLILKGVLRADEQMPSVRKLSVELQTNPNTVQRAYAELERQGFLYSVKGKGSFVRGDTLLRSEKLLQMRGQITAILREADELGISREELFADLPGIHVTGKEGEQYD